MKKLFTALKNICKSSIDEEVSLERETGKTKTNVAVHKSGKQVLYSPIEGEIIDLSKVPEGSFSGKVLGDGFAVIPAGNKVYSPADGEVIVLFPTKHALVLLTDEGLEVLVHIGINTSSLKGEGFSVHVKKGDKVKAGDLLISFDNEIIIKSGKSLISPIIITNMNSVKGLSIDFGNKKVLEKVAEIKTII
ncbi:PTS glucose transporter subunit IIA [Clostridium sp. C2-6-12]|uniref:PTS sugar transporter subunit IIA n=1 Tax=Clostridium sp. C2-6-12 TaxID=2698832 RepID=UPI001371095D|nr:PTS glucose transporter subunit IIA [Clostridium sp. C2-6-12]